MEVNSDDDITIRLTVTTTSTMSDGFPEFSNYRVLNTKTTDLKFQTVDTTTTTPRLHFVTSTESPTHSTESTSTTTKATTTFTTSFTTSTSISTSSSHDSASRTVKSLSETENAYSAVLTSNLPSDSARLGMAIGIPLAFVLLVSIGFGFWYYIEHKQPKPEKLMYNNNQFYKVSNNQQRSLDSFTNPYSELYHQEKPYYEQQQQQQPMAAKNWSYRLSSLITPINFKTVQDRLKRGSVRFFNRSSRHADIEEAEEEEEEMPLEVSSGSGKLSQSNPHRQSLVSPLFLKRFNLNKPFTPLTPKGGSNSANSGPKVPKNVKSYQNKPIPKLPSLLNNIDFENVIDHNYFSVVKRYKKSLPDELDIHINETVKILKNHSDGWRLIKKLTTNEVGMVPKLCLRFIQ